MPKAPPSFDFYPNDWIGGTRHLTLVERACYLELLMHQWQNGHIPIDPVQRMHLCGVPECSWRTIWDRIKDKFEPKELDDASVVFVNHRMDVDRDEAIASWKPRKEVSDARRRAGRKGGIASGKKRRNNVTPKIAAQNPRSKTEAKPKQNEAKLEGGRGKLEGGSYDSATAPPTSVAQVGEVVSHYQKYHPRSCPGSKERRLIQSRIDDGYTVSDLKTAIDGCHVSPHHCGVNETGKTYQRLDLIVRDASHVDQFIAAWDTRNNAPTTSTQLKTEFGKHRTVQRLMAEQEQRERKGIANATHTRNIRSID